MIHSQKLEDLFKQYDPDWLYKFLKEIYGIAYTKTFSNSGLYIWFGKQPSDFFTNPAIDTNLPMCIIKTGKYYDDIFDGDKVEGTNVFLFLETDEEKIINKFTKYSNLKVFL